MTTLPRVLLVDDEPNLLNGLRRQLRRDFDVTIAVGAANGLFALKDGPYQVIVSDFLMPGINGAEFLAAVRKAAPDATRMLLTGHTNLADAATTVNEGGIFRMLLKPVDPATMTAALQDCVAQHRLVTGERELLEQTLHGSVNALIDVLALASPAAFEKAGRMRRTAAAVLDRVESQDRWAVELAVMLSQLGAVALPPAVVDKLGTGEPLTEPEQHMVDDIPRVAGRLLAGIPRLTGVTDAIREADSGGAEAPLGARLLRLVRDYDALVENGTAPAVASVMLQARPDRYDPVLLEALAATSEGDDLATVSAVALDEVRIGMVLAAAVHSGSGTLLVNSGQQVTPSLMSRLQNFAALEDGVAEPLLVHAPAAVTASGTPASVR